MVASITLLAGHPYFIFSSANVRKAFNKDYWEVIWRDFYTIKQERIFDTEIEARKFAEKIMKPPITISGEELSEDDLEDANQFWHCLKK